MAKLAVSEKGLVVLNFIKENADTLMTAADIADALGMEKKSVEGIVTSGLQRKGLTVRVPAEIELEDGTHKAVKLIQATEAGMNYDHDSAVAADEAAKPVKEVKEVAEDAE